MNTHDGRLKIVASIMESTYHYTFTNKEFRVVVNALSRWLEKSRGATE